MTNNTGIDYSKNLQILRYFTFFAEFKFFGAFRTVYFGLLLDSSFMAGLLLSIYTLSSVIADVPLGLFSDIYGKKKTLILGAVCSFLGVLVYVVSSRFEILVIGTVLEGIAMACFSGNNDAIIFESIELANKENSNKLDFNREYGKIMSYFQMAMLVASFGSLLVGMGINWLVYLSLPFLIINIFLSLQLVDLPTPKAHNKPLRQFWVQIRISWTELLKNKKLTLVGFLNALEYAFAETTYYFRSNFVASLWSIQYVGLSKVISSLMATFSFRIGNKVIQKFGIKNTLVFGGLLARLIDIFSTILNSLLSPILMGFSSLFYGTTTISKTSYLQSQLTTSNRSTIPSFVSLLGNILFAVFSILFGFLSDSYGVFLTFVIFEIAYVFVNIGYTFIERVPSTKS